MRPPAELYPIAIVEDRYTGVYSGGVWLAIAEADRNYEERSRVDFILSDGPHGEDLVAMEFWRDPPGWIAVGHSPQEALDRLIEKAAPDY